MADLGFVNVTDPVPIHVSAFEAPEAQRHYRILAGHGTYLHPDEIRFVSPELIEASCIVGRLDEVVEKIGELETAGLDQVMVLPSFSARYRAAQEVGFLIRALG